MKSIPSYYLFGLHFHTIITNCQLFFIVFFFLKYVPYLYSFSSSLTISFSFFFKDLHDCLVMFYLFVSLVRLSLIYCSSSVPVHLFQTAELSVRWTTSSRSATTGCSLRASTAAPLSPACSASRCCPAGSSWSPRSCSSASCAGRTCSD